MSKDPKVDQYMAKATRWQEEFKALRGIALKCGLDESIKWRLPCYSKEGKNIVILQTFKEYCALMFFKGALLKDSKKILSNIGNSQAGRQARFTDVAQIKRAESTLQTYIDEAIEVEKAGLQVKMKKTSDFAMPEEFKQKLDSLPKLKTAFTSLTPGRQRAYLYYFSQAKQSETREARVKKSIPQIIQGKGLND